jgi:tryptophan-rich sensory protein
MLLVFAALVSAAASTGQLFPPDQWYRTLEKPAWNPPNWIFPVVWTPLYVTIAVAGWLIWRSGARAALGWWAVQLALNALWTPLFFGWHEPAWALADIVALWAAIGATIAAAWRRQRAAAWMLAPYWGWVTFAAALNAALWQLNRG